MQLSSIQERVKNFRETGMAGGYFENSENSPEMSYTSPRMKMRQFKTMNVSRS